jgi:RimJ/RimL family protein N-acetyltransferase
VLSIAAFLDQNNAAVAEGRALIETRTARLRLVAGTLELAVAELEDRDRFATLIRADVPPEWPPESLRDALPFFRDLHQEHPDWAGWLGWYAIAITEARPVLCGSVGFKGPPDDAGMVEIGYSLLPSYRHAGLASEMVAGLIGWAGRDPRVRSIEAETTPDNLRSIRVLERNGFEPVGEGIEPGAVRFRRNVARSIDLNRAPGV